jgi:hypothetical protein
LVGRGLIKTEENRALGTTDRSQTKSGERLRPDRHFRTVDADSDRTDIDRRVATPLPPVVSVPSGATKLANFPKNEHWRSCMIEDSIACKTHLSAQ